MNIHHWLRGIVVAGALACGCDSETQPMAVDAMTDLYVCNLSTGFVTKVHLRGPSDAEWGHNLLTRSIAAGDCFGFVKAVPSGRYDVHVVGDRGELELLGFEIVSSEIAIMYSDPVLGSAASSDCAPLGSRKPAVQDLSPGRRGAYHIAALDRDRGPRLLPVPAALGRGG